MSLQIPDRPIDNPELASTPVTVAYGDGIGPEIMEATLRVLREAGAKLAIETIEVGERIYNMNSSTGILPSSWDSLRRTKVLLKAPITTPQGKGYKSLNVTLRKTLGLYANIRPVQSYYPVIKSMHPKMDMVIIRENEEDLYAGIEYRHSEDSFHCIKLITLSGSERIIRYAFDYAVRHNRKKVTCMSKDNIMKMADGLFHKLFDEIGKDYPGIEKNHYIIDIGAARIASRPEIFDVIVTENLYGDIISDIAAEVSGSVGLAGSANIGEDFAMFEAIHGSAPDIAGQNIANPSGILHAAVMMLVHIGQAEVATRVHNALYKTLEDGIHTPDIFREGHSIEKAGTSEFADAVIQRLNQKPAVFKPVDYKPAEKFIPSNNVHITSPIKRELIGVDLFFHMADRAVEECAHQIKAIEGDGLELKNLANKGLKVWPDARTSGMHLTDQYRARFRVAQGKTTNNAAIASLIARAQEKGLDCVHVENLYLFDGAPGFSLGQGE